MSRVTLTFDNGPDPEVTPRVLDVLAKHGVRATFFVIGRALEMPGARNAAERAVAEGHWLGNHTYSHAVPLGELGAAEARREIDRTQAALGVLAHADRLFRPFGGGGHLDRRLLNGAARDRLIEGGFTCVLWDTVPRDWDDPDGWADRALAAVASRDWSVVVLHDIPGACLDRLDGFLDGLRQAGHTQGQEFPDACVPLRRGVVVGDLDRYVAGG